MQSNTFRPICHLKMMRPKMNCNASPHIKWRQRILPGCFEKIAPKRVMTTKPKIDNNLLRSSEESTIRKMRKPIITTELIITEANLIFIKSSHINNVGLKTLCMAFSPIVVDVKNQLNVLLHSLEYTTKITTTTVMIIRNPKP